MAFSLAAKHRRKPEGQERGAAMALKNRNERRQRQCDYECRARHCGTIVAVDMREEHRQWGKWRGCATAYRQLR